MRGRMWDCAELSRTLQLRRITDLNVAQENQADLQDFFANNEVY